MTITDILNNINIDMRGDYAKDSTYVIDIDNSTEFGKVYSLLESAKDNEILDYMDENSSMNADYANLSYLYLDDEQFQLSLIGDFKNNLYKLVINNH